MFVKPYHRKNQIMARYEALVMEYNPNQPEGYEHAIWSEVFLDQNERNDYVLDMALQAAKFNHECVQHGLPKLTLTILKTTTDNDAISVPIESVTV